MIDYLHEIENLRVHKSGGAVSLHKPLLLLLTISEILRGHNNEFIYDDIEPELRNLLVKYGLKHTNNFKPEFPFIYLSSNSNLWNCSVKKGELKHPDAASRKELMGAIGHLSLGFLNYIRQGNNGMTLIKSILTQYWTDAYHEDIMRDLGISELSNATSTVRQERSRRFVENVLDAYERKCAICNQSLRLGDALLGIDACHVKPLQHYGHDDVNNGIALCKLHHWALDRGAISISNEMQLMVSKKLNGSKMVEYFTSFENLELFIPRDSMSNLYTENVIYHREYIFLK